MAGIEHVLHGWCAVVGGKSQRASRAKYEGVPRVHLLVSQCADPVKSFFSNCKSIAGDGKHRSAVLLLASPTENSLNLFPSFGREGRGERDDPGFLLVKRLNSSGWAFSFDWL